MSNYGGDVLVIVLFSVIARFSHGFSIFDAETLRNVGPLMLVNLNISSYADMIRKFCADLALQPVNIPFHIHMWLQFCKIGQFRPCISNMSNENGQKVPWVNSGRVIDLLANGKKENRWEAKDHGSPKTKSKEVLATGKMVALRKLLDPKIGPSLDLQLSSSLRPIKLSLGTETRKWRATNQIRIAAMESAYAKRVMEMTRRELEMAQSEFAHARHMWERAREEMDRVEKMKERATHRIDSCMEITCQACRRKFRPY
ncbi:hypothetical protein E3N88_26029 [Mikania micrantha]|uniref:Uncharacterized protein n=1 Tax=Mikania micrantha TaxID=192012 RepID=A0A5N6N814_9ASTR|nr:hypothetical protein E3N88_26029 [Mikania micrantha]